MYRRPVWGFVVSFDNRAQKSKPTKPRGRTAIRRAQNSQDHLRTPKTVSALAGWRAYSIWILHIQFQKYIENFNEYINIWWKKIWKANWVTNQPIYLQRCKLQLHQASITVYVWILHIQPPTGIIFSVILVSEYRHTSHLWAVFNPPWLPTCT